MNQTTPIARNHIRITRALFGEALGAAESSEYKKSVKKAAVFIILIFAAAAAWLLYTGGSLFFLLGEAVFLGALLFWLMIMFPNSRRNSKYKAMTHGTAGIPERTTTFYQSHLSVAANDGKETVIQYSDIKNWQKTKNLYLIICQNNVIVLLDKKGFDAGDFETVKERIN